MDREDFVGYVFVAIIVAIIVSILSGIFYLIIWTKIWRQDIAGRANLKQQEWEKQIIIEEAKAKKDAASLYAQAEVERAKGVAEANKIIGDSLKGNEAYLKYLMIDTLKDQDTQLIYVPTEAGLPILEANRR